MVTSSTRPPATLARTFCTARDTARDSTDSNATRDVTGMPSWSAVMSTVTTHSTSCTVRTRYFCTRASIWVRASTRRNRAVISRTDTRQITSVSRAPSSVPREILPRCRADRSSF